MSNLADSKKNEAVEPDYVIDDNGNYVFTKKYHLRRGYCCGCSCLNCPYDGVLGSKRIGDCKET
ncbi:MAG: DUF5522 domain-containing protein [bacterium]|nr:DUF5522 domain-containing protein [bacterium]